MEAAMTSVESKRLAEIRSRCELWSAVRDTSTWETSFLLKLLEDKDREIQRLRDRVARQV
jgi:hypothetical protein